MSRYWLVYTVLAIIALTAFQLQAQENQRLSVPGRFQQEPEQATWGMDYPGAVPSDDAEDPFSSRNPFDVQRLGETPFDQDPQRIQLAEYPTQDSGSRDEDPKGHYTEPSWNPFPFLSEQYASMPRDPRRIVLKEIAVTDTVLFPVGGDFGMNTLDLRGTLFFGKLPILTFSPRFSYHSIMDRQSAGLPSQLYDTGIDAFLYLPLTPKWSLITGVGPSMFTDGHNLSSEAFRMTGRAIAMYQYSEFTKLAFGFLYLGREDVPAIPFGGVYYTPHENFKMELVFPRPKVAWKLASADQNENWVYLLGELGGNSWAVERFGGFNDIMTLRDYRLIGGFEQIRNKDFRWLVEAGFVFGREVEYRSNIGNSKQSPTGLVRGGLVF
ncbi:DUF6268 family outer membrane beta-barrel protein [Planctomicrobium sp. SH668]|uniref:DUF6268 family outer membrane beta-barrel protein n=1 Tax=Planctomicrobium sp. SH668 TaxID=3448126 RepID=UPI003F5BAEC3